MKTSTATLALQDEDVAAGFPEHPSVGALCQKGSLGCTHLETRSGLPGHFSAPCEGAGSSQMQVTGRDSLFIWGDLTPGALTKLSGSLAALGAGICRHLGHEDILQFCLKSNPSGSLQSRVKSLRLLSDLFLPLSAW